MKLIPTILAALMLLVGCGGSNNQHRRFISALQQPAESNVRHPAKQARNSAS